MALENQLLRESDNPQHYTAGGAIVAGELTQLADGRASVLAGLQTVASGDEVSGHTAGVWALKSASATTFSLGDRVMWDASANLAVLPSLAADGSADFFAGTCVRAKVAAELVVHVALNLEGPGDNVRPTVFEFDCATAGGDLLPHQLIPAEMNPHGLLCVNIFGIVTEVFAGSSEDQGVILVEDESGNTLATLTALDAAADAVGDIVEGFFTGENATGVAHTGLVAAGEFIDARVSQQTAGTPAGKIKVYIQTIPLV